MGEKFVCERCGNTDPRYVGMKGDTPYCRKCIGFCGAKADVLEIKPRAAALALKYPLTAFQEDLSHQIIQNFKSGIDTLIYAVCGSGKTEISYGVIAYAMSKGLSVGFALPRRDVVIELFFRLKEAFPDRRVVAVYGQHTSRLEGDLLILTTHQLYRYPAYFDLLVMDEIDAFPFKGNEVLISLFRRSLRGHCVMMSATPSKTIVKEFTGPNKAMLTLHTRFHKHPIPVPKMVQKFGFTQVLFVIEKLKEFQKRGDPCFVFVPSVAVAESLFHQVAPWVKGGNYVSSKREGRETIIEKFKQGGYRFLITTAVLERGITVKGLQVIVYHADDRIYDAAALVQIAGRAGRKASHPDGEVYFLVERETEGVKHAIAEIRHCNTFLPKVLPTHS